MWISILLYRYGIKGNAYDMKEKDANKREKKIVGSQTGASINGTRLLRFVVRHDFIFPATSASATLAPFHLSLAEKR